MMRTETTPRERVIKALYLQGVFPGLDATTAAADAILAALRIPDSLADE